MHFAQRFFTEADTFISKLLCDCHPGRTPVGLLPNSHDHITYLLAQNHNYTLRGAFRKGFCAFIHHSTRTYTLNQALEDIFGHQFNAAVASHNSQQPVILKELNQGHRLFVVDPDTV